MCVWVTKPHKPAAMAFKDLNNLIENFTDKPDDWNFSNAFSSSSSNYNEIGYNHSNESRTTDDTPYEDYKYRPETYMVPIMFGMIFIVGVVGNGTLIIVFIKHRAMRNVPNT